MRYEGLIQKIREHPRYGPAMERAAADDVQLVLNYHTHSAGGRYCVSILAKTGSLLETWMKMGPADLEELVHIEGFGADEASCLPLCSELATDLRRAYGFAQSPVIHLNGQPLSGTPGPDPANGKPRGDA